MIAIRPLAASDEADWRRMWTLYLEYYETSPLRAPKNSQKQMGQKRTIRLYFDFWCQLKRFQPLGIG